MSWPNRRPPRARPAASPLAWLLAVAASLSAAASLAGEAPAPALVVVERCLTQDQGSWQVDYRLRHDGPTGRVITPGEISARVEGDVSNSRVPGHAVPRPATATLSGPTGPSAVADVVLAADESRHCRERVTVAIRDGLDPTEPPPAAPPGSSSTPPATWPILSLAPGGTVLVRVRLDHDHVIYGDYDPLLGVRDLEIRLGPIVFRDRLPLDREQHHAQAKGTWAEPPPDRKDARLFISAPDSLHLEAHVPGNQYYRFPERPVRYSTRMRLRYWYLVAPGSEGELRVRLSQYKETRTAWKVLSDGSSDEPLAVVGRWVRVERIFRTEGEATTLALDFRIAGPPEVGEAWIDDVVLEPVQEGPGGP